MPRTLGSCGPHWADVPALSASWLNILLITCRRRWTKTTLIRTQCENGFDVMRAEQSFGRKEGTMKTSMVLMGLYMLSRVQINIRVAILLIKHPAERQ
jgi:hypothetical protein